MGVMVVVQAVLEAAVATLEMVLLELPTKDMPEEIQHKVIPVLVAEVLVV
jgi:hypothetical protein